MNNNKTVFNIYWHNFSNEKIKVDLIQSIVGSLAQ